MTLPAPLVTAAQAEFRAAMPGGGALLGLDLGTQTIGTAFCDAGWRFASPGKTLKRGKFGADKVLLAALIAERSIRGIVIGLPLNMDGTEGPRVQSTRAFVRHLVPLTNLPILFWDERMSTLAVTRTLLDADASRAKRAAVVDKMAAAYILQGALDRLARIESAAAEDADPDQP